MFHDCGAGGVESELPTGEDLDTIIYDMEVAYEGIKQRPIGVVQLRKYEVKLLASFEMSTNLMHQVMKVCSDRALLVELFGGDCHRIAWFHWFNDNTEFSQMFINDRRVADFRSACLSVDEILADIGLKAALEEAKKHAPLAATKSSRRRSCIDLGSEKRSGGYGTAPAAQALPARKTIEEPMLVPCTPSFGSSEAPDRKVARPRLDSERAADALRSGELERTVSKFFAVIDVGGTGNLDWNSRQIPNFIEKVFSRFELATPDEGQMYWMYQKHDKNGDWLLDEEECQSLIKMFVISIYDLAESDDQRAEVDARAEETLERHFGPDVEKLPWSNGQAGDFICNVFAELGLPKANEQQTHALFGRYDADKDGCLDRAEALLLLETLCRAKNSAKGTDAATTCSCGRAMHFFTTTKEGFLCHVCGLARREGEILWQCEPCSSLVCIGCSKKRLGG